MKCPTCQTPLQYGVCSTCKEEKYLREERQAIQKEPLTIIRRVFGAADLPTCTDTIATEPYWEPGIYQAKGET